MTRVSCVDLGIKLIFILTHAYMVPIPTFFALINFQPIRHDMLLLVFNYNKSYSILLFFCNRFVDKKIQLKKKNKSYIVFTVRKKF